MSDAIGKYIVIIMLGIAAIMVWLSIDKQLKCSDAGGIYIRQAFSFVCARVEIIK